MKAIPMSPVIIKVIPSPRKGAGTFEYCIFSRMAAIPTIARKNPTPDPSPNTVASPILAYSLSCINRDPPRMAQLTAINGRNIPRDEYRAGANFSTTISTSCTIDAIKLELGRSATGFSNYRSNGLITQRLAPDYLDCDGLNDPYEALKILRNAYDKVME